MPELSARNERRTDMMDDKKNTARPRGTDSAEVISVIVTEALVGSGTDKDPCRIQRQFWSLDGTLLAVNED